MSALSAAAYISHARRGAFCPLLADGYYHPSAAGQHAQRGASWWHHSSLRLSLASLGRTLPPAPPGSWLRHALGLSRCVAPGPVQGCCVASRLSPSRRSRGVQQPGGPPACRRAAAATTRPPDITSPRGCAHARRARSRRRSKPCEAGRRAHARRGGGVSGGPWQVRERRAGAGGALVRYPLSGAPAALLTRGR